MAELEEELEAELIDEVLSAIEDLPDEVDLTDEAVLGDFVEDLVVTYEEEAMEGLLDEYGLDFMISADDLGKTCKI